MLTRKTTQTSALPGSHYNILLTLRYWLLYLFFFLSATIVGLHKLISKCQNKWKRPWLLGSCFVSVFSHASISFVLSHHHPCAHSMASVIFQPLLASNWYWFCRLLLMCLVPKRNLSVPLSSSSPQKKRVFITSEQMAVLSNFPRLKRGGLSSFRVCLKCGDTFSAPRYFSSVHWYMKCGG